MQLKPEKIIKEVPSNTSPIILNPNKPTLSSYEPNRSNIKKKNYNIKNNKTQASIDEEQILASLTRLNKKLKKIKLKTLLRPEDPITSSRIRDSSENIKILSPDKLKLNKIELNKEKFEPITNSCNNKKKKSIPIKPHLSRQRKISLNNSKRIRNGGFHSRPKEEKVIVSPYHVQLLRS